MKFYCDVCNTKYSIADEKVRGKVLKVRCKKCSNIITVREALAPVGNASQPVPALRQQNVPITEPTETPTTNWYYSVNGQSSAALPLATIQKKFASGELGDEAYVWHESIVEWKPVRSVPIFADHLDKGQAVKPRSKTLGFTGKIEAIKAPLGPNVQREGAVPSTTRPAPTPEQSREPAIRADKLDRLRDKLRKDDPVARPAAKSQPKEALPEPVENATHSLTFAPGVNAAAPVGQVDVPRSEAAIELPGFDLPPAGSATRDEFPDANTSSTSDILDEPVRPLPHGLGETIPQITESPVDDSGIIPFFPDAPKLEGAHTPAVQQSQTTGSLLIQLQEIKKEGRGKAVFAVVGIAVLLAVIATVAITMAVTNKEEVVEQPEIATKTDQKKEIKEIRYSKNKLQGFSNLTLKDDVIGEDEKVEDLEPEEEAPANPKIAALSPRPKEVRPKEASKVQTGQKVAMKAPEKPRKKEPEAKANEPPAKPMTARERLLKYGSGGTGPAINRPEDKLVEGELPKTLSKDDARRGFKKIRRSVMACRERHTRRGGRFEEKKVKVTVIVDPKGTVSTFKTNSASLEGTEFDLCMKSHQSRWKFAKWEGVPSTINTSFILQ